MRSLAAPQAGAADADTRFRLSHGMGFAGAVLVVMVSEQAILNSGVLIVKVQTGSNALAALIFAVLMIARAPLQLFQAVSTTLLPHLTRLMVKEQDESREGDFARSVRLTVSPASLSARSTVIGVLLVGPAVMRLLFGPQFDYDRGGLALVAAGMGLYLAATTVNQAVLAQGNARLAAGCWAVSATFFVLFLLVGKIEEVREVEVAFLSTAGAPVVPSLSRLPPPLIVAQEIRPGSVEELEARLAAADEGSSARPAPSAEPAQRRAVVVRLRDQAVLAPRASRQPYVRQLSRPLHSQPGKRGALGCPVTGELDRLLEAPLVGVVEVLHHDRVEDDRRHARPTGRASCSSTQSTALARSTGGTSSAAASSAERSSSMRSTWSPHT